MPLVAADTRSWIKRQLGDPTVVVELTDDQLDDAIEEALEQYSSVLPKLIRVNVQGAVGQMKYTVAAGTYGRGGAIRVEVEPTYLTGHHLDIFNPQDVALALNQAGADHVDFAMALSGVKTAKAVLSSDFDWQFAPGDDPATDDGYLYVSPEPASAQVYVLECTANWALGDVPRRSHRWVQNYALSRSKVTLGMIRRKFGTINGAQTALETDGATLVQEGTQEMEAARRFLWENKNSAAIVPIRGI